MPQRTPTSCFHVSPAATHTNNLCRPQETRAEDLPWHRPHGLAELGPGPVPVHRVGHVLLLHLEGDKVDGKGWWRELELDALVLPRPSVILFFSPSLARTCIHVGGLLHGDLPLHHADRAAYPRTHPARRRHRHKVLPLPRPWTTRRPTGECREIPLDWC